MKIGRTAWTIVGALIASAVGNPGSSAKVDPVGPFCTSEEAWLVRSGAEEIGDRYILAGGGISMDGCGWCESV